MLTARPSAADEAEAPHRLYGHVPVGEDHSVGRWLTETDAVLAECATQGLRPIIVGGTGLYFRALTQGLARVPPVPASVRAEAEAALARLGREAFAAALAARDPETAAGLDAGVDGRSPPAGIDPPIFDRLKDRRQRPAAADGLAQLPAGASGSARPTSRSPRLPRAGRPLGICRGIAPPSGLPGGQWPGPPVLPQAGRMNMRSPVPERSAR